MKAADIRQTLSWLDGPAGRRVTLAEASGASSMSQETMRTYFEGEKQKPPNPGRERMIADLIKATKSVEIGASFIEATSLGIAVGMDATQPVEKRIGIAGLRARLRTVMPPEKLKAEMSAMLPPMFGYVYREISDADLAAYVKFSASPLGKRYNEAVSAALIGALARASVRVGEMLPVSAERSRSERPAHARPGSVPFQAAGLDHLPPHGRWRSSSGSRRSDSATGRGTRSSSSAGPSSSPSCASGFRSGARAWPRIA
jgi:hypothetical protein